MENTVVLRVALDGSEEFRSVAAAVAAAQERYDEKTVAVRIEIAPGVYRERVEIRRANTELVGETADAVTIVGSLGAFQDADDGLKLGTFRTYTMLVDAPDVTLRRLTIQNDAGDGRAVGQAIALYADGDRLVVDGCRLLGRQDTVFLGPLPPKELQPNGFIGPKQFDPRIVGRQYWRRCYIEGDVDFIFGGATAYFEGCEIHSLDRGDDPNGYVTAASTPEESEYGFVFHGCSFTSDCAAQTVYLGRPWRDWARTVLVDCWLGDHIKREGWFDWNKPHARECCQYAGTGLVGPGMRDAAWDDFAQILPASDATRYSRERVLAGKDGWDPEGGAGDAVETAHLSANGRTLVTDGYFDAEESFRARFRAEGRRDAFAGGDTDAFCAWQRKARSTLSEVLGLGKLTSVATDAQVHESVPVAGGIVRERCSIAVEEGVRMPFYVLHPANPLRDEAGALVTVICPHGHQGAGAASVAGVMGSPAVDDAIRKFNYDYGLRLAQLGYTAVCPEARGFGARRDRMGRGDDEPKFMRSTCVNTAHMAEPLGISLAGLLTWDLMRLVDYLASRGDIAMGRLACVGFSGGGLQTLMLAAVDTRVRAALISGYLYGYEDSLLHLNGNCACNYVPGLWLHFDMGDIAALIAGRPLVVQSCAEDHLNGPRGLDNVYEQLDVVRAGYGLLGDTGLLVHEVIPGDHHFGIQSLPDHARWLVAHAQPRAE